MDIIILIFAFIFGISIGSMLNVVVLRYPELYTMVNTRSHCPKCKTQLRWYDLIPFFSYVLLWGKCRYCKTKISAQYPIVELVAAIITTAVIYKFGISWQAGILLLISYFLIIISVFDIQSMTIPDVFLWIVLVLSIVYVVVGYFTIAGYHLNLYQSLIGGAIFGGFPFLLWLLTRGNGMGIGDAKIGLPLGLILAFPQAIIGLISSIFIGSIFSLSLVAFKKRGMKDAVPFGPFMVIGFFIALFFGAYLWHIYLPVW